VKSRIQKWGNSLAVRIPKPVALDAGLESGAPVEVLLRDRSVVITRAAPQGFTLEQLLEEVTPENVHGEVDTGPAAGKEAW
jgi:antitoxin MazE